MSAIKSKRPWTSSKNLFRHSPKFGTSLVANVLFGVCFRSSVHFLTHLDQTPVTRIVVFLSTACNDFGVRCFFHKTKRQAVSKSFQELAVRYNLKFCVPRTLSFLGCSAFCTRRLLPCFFTSSPVACFLHESHWRCCEVFQKKNILLCPSFCWPSCPQFRYQQVSVNWVLPPLLHSYGYFFSVSLQRTRFAHVLTTSTQTLDIKQRSDRVPRHCQDTWSFA